MIMTVAEAILSFSGLEDTSANALQRTLVLRQLNGADEFVVDQNKAVNLAAADLYVELVNSPDFGEGSLSITRSRKYYTSTAARLYRENGEPDKASSLYKSITVSGKATSRW